MGFNKLISFKYLNVVHPKKGLIFCFAKRKIECCVVDVASLQLREAPPSADLITKFDYIVIVHLYNLSALSSHMCALFLH